MNLNLIFDRTENDVAEAKRILAKVQAGTTLSDDERTAYFAGLRACYTTVPDMNRVEAAVVELSALLNSYGYQNTTVTRTWAIGDIVNGEQLAQYIANVQSLIDAYYTLADSPELPSASDKLTYEGANAIERLLYDINYLIECMESSFRKSGTFQSGSNAAHLPLRRSVT